MENVKDKVKGVEIKELNKENDACAVFARLEFCDKESIQWKEKLGDALLEIVDEINNTHPSHFRGYSHSIVSNVINTLDYVLTSDDCWGLRKLSEELGKPIFFEDYHRASGTKHWKGWCLYVTARVSIKKGAAEVKVNFWEDKTYSSYDAWIPPCINGVRNFYRQIYCEDALKYVKEIERLKLLDRAEFLTCKAIDVVKVRDRRYLVLRGDDKIYVFEVGRRIGRAGATYLVDVAEKTLWRTNKTLLSTKFEKEPPLEVKKALLPYLL